MLVHASNPACGFSMIKQVRLYALWPMENWLGPSLNQIQDWTTVLESYSRALEDGSLERRGQPEVAIVSISPFPSLTSENHRHLESLL